MFINPSTPSTKNYLNEQSTYNISEIHKARDAVYQIYMDKEASKSEKFLVNMAYKELVDPWWDNPQFREDFNNLPQFFLYKFIDRFVSYPGLTEDLLDFGLNFFKDLEGLSPEEIDKKLQKAMEESAQYKTEKSDYQKFINDVYFLYLTIDPKPFKSNLPSNPFGM